MGKGGCETESTTGTQQNSLQWLSVVGAMDLWGYAVRDESAGRPLAGRTAGLRVVVAVAGHGAD